MTVGLFEFKKLKKKKKNQKKLWNEPLAENLFKFLSGMRYIDTTDAQMPKVFADFTVDNGNEWN